MQKQRSLGKRSRRPRHEAPKVWHNPDVVTAPVGRAPTKRSSAAAESARAAALSAPSASAAVGSKTAAPNPRPQRIVAAASGPTDPKELERERLLARLAAAEGRPAITRAADALLAAGFELPDHDQGIQLQLLEHSKEQYVEAALEQLARILDSEPCKRQTVLESRLRRLEEFADEPSTRDAARRLRRQVTGRSRETDGGSSPATLRSETE